MNDQSVVALNEKFGSDVLSFVDSPSGPVAEIANDLCTARVALHGAHVLSYVPTGHSEVIFVSEKAIHQVGTAVRGGIPVCWPWFGSHPDGGDVYSHGFGRRFVWEVTEAGVSDGATVVSLALQGQGDSFPGWPYPVDGRVTVTAGETLSVSLTTLNGGDTPFTISSALHTYFRVGDVRSVRLRGLDGCSYQDDVDGGIRKVQAGDVTVDGEVDRVYLGTKGACEIVDPALDRTIVVSKRGSESTVVWNPWVEIAAGMKDMGDKEYVNMLCVETTNALADARTVAPGASHTVTQVISVK